MLKKKCKNNFKALGNKGENIAANFLTEIGYKIIDRNFKSFYGEIDIIAKDKKEIVFIEVKTRRNMHFGEAIDSITSIKRKHIFNTAKYFLYINNAYKASVRFDVVEIYRCNNQTIINHIKNVNLE